MTVEATVRTRQSRQAVHRILTELPQTLAGRGSHDSAQLRTLFLANFANSLFGSIFNAYVVKSRGQTDELGTRWKPLAASTIRRKQKMDPSVLTMFGIMSAAKVTKWKATRDKLISQLRIEGMSQKDAAAKSSRLTWQLHNTAAPASNVPIGIETGALGLSFRPGTVRGARYYKPANQIFQETSGGVTLGSSVPHAKHFHKKRPIFPGVRRMRPWTRRAAAAATRAVVKALASTL